MPEKIKIDKTDNKITISFLQTIDSIDILNIIYFYIKTSIISKILLVINRNGVDWYNDITAFTKKSLLFLWVKLNEYNIYKQTHSSHITEDEINNQCRVIIETINKDNHYPVLIGKKKFQSIIFNEWIKNV